MISSARVATAPDAIPTKIRFERCGNFLCERIATAKIAITDGINAKFRNSLYDTIEIEPSMR